MSDIQVSKSILAKLLATENITVSHQATQTAYFDLKNRTLVCPVWKDMDGALYDLLMGHEVGHALETPTAGWHGALQDDEGKKVSNRFKGFLNVLEDARIEKKIKRRYPGLARSFATAYKDLYDRDFFGIKEVDVNTLNLIDRINLRFKMGAHVPVSFTDAERAFVNETENLETWDQVVDLAKRIYGYVKDEEESKIQNMDDLQEQIEEQNKQFKDQSSDADDESDQYDESDEDADSQYGEESDEESDLDQESNGEQSQQSDAEATEDENEQESMASGGGEEDSGEPESVTDRNFRQRESELVNSSGVVHMYELPEANLDKIVLPNQTVMNDLECFIRMQVADKSRPYGRNGISYETVLAKCTRKFHNNNKKFVNHILKEFEMRKRASQYARSLTSKTGELNMNVLHNYKFSNDLFKKITVAPKGKNHGLIMYVDMSGSMTDILRNTLEQTLVLVSFCKLANIPYEVYGFSNDYYNASKKDIVNGIGKFTSSPNGVTVETGGFHLKHLIGSSLSPAANRRAFGLLCIVANEYWRGYDSFDSDSDHGFFQGNWEESGFGLNGTPFIQTLLASREQITKFRNERKLDIVNVIYLTDGEGSSAFNYPQSYYSSNYRNSSMYFVDKKTKKKIRVEQNQQTAITQLVREVTGCKHIGFFLCSERDIRHKSNEMLWSNKWTQKEANEFRKQFRTDGFASTPNLGYDNYFYIQHSRKNIAETVLKIDDKMTKNKMANEFKKSISSKKNSRALVSKFAENLAVA
jgi:hypothetical protein